MSSGNYGSDEFGVSPYGGAFDPYGLESVTPLTTTLLRVRYTALFDASFPALLAVSNYNIAPALTIYGIIQETAQSVLLITDPQDAVLYTLTIDSARGYFGQPLDPNFASRTFNGALAFPTFLASATRKTRVRATFTAPMLVNAALTDPAHYVVTDLSGNVIPITAVTAEQAANVQSVVLTLGEDLVDERQYQLTVLSGVVTVGNEALSPDTALFQWNENALNAQIPIALFTGEVQNGLYGIHGGLVFFSPALENSAANSIIEVDSVDVCTKAYDEYTMPQPIDPPVLYTYGAGVVATPAVTTLNSTAALWAKFPRLMEATMTLSDFLEDAMPAATDGPCDATLQETWDLDYVSLLNADTWKLFDNAGEPPVYFKTADNLAPVPAGSTTNINLQP